MKGPEPRHSGWAWPPSSPAALLRMLEAGGGLVQVVDPSEDVRAAWRRLLHVVRRDGHVPDGWHLLHRGRNVGDLVIELRPGDHPARRYRPSPAGSVVVPDQLVDPHPVVAALRDQPKRLPASSGNRSRALMLLEALAREAQRRGHQVQPAKAAMLMTVVASGVAYGVEVYEGSGARWTLRLAVRIDGPGEGTSVWADYAKRPVENELAAVLDEIGRRGAAVVAERQERERREQEARRREYAAAVTRHHARILRRQVAAWRQAIDIRWHCDEMVATGLDPHDDWIRWARRYADDLDPVVDPSGLPDPPTEQELARERLAQRRPAPAADVLPPPREWHPNRRWWSQ